jgi:acylphosphatase
MMIRLTAYISGRVQRVGYRAKVVSRALEIGLAGIVQNQPDGSVLVIAEGEKKEDLEKFVSAITIKNALIHVEDISAEYSQGSGQYSSFRKITGPNEVGERLDDGIEILKRMLDKQDETMEVIRGLTTITKDGFESLGGKMDHMLDKQGETIEEIRGLRVDLKSYMDRRFKRIEADLAELKEMKAALKEKGII